MPYKNLEDKRAHERSYMATYRDKHRARLRTRQREWYLANRERIRACKDAWRAAHPLVVKRWDRNQGYKRRHGITLLEFEAMVIAQGGLCASCGEAANLVLDHNHLTKQRRGTVCQGCNLAIGHCKDSPEKLEKAAAYLRSFDKAQGTGNGH